MNRALHTKASAFCLKGAGHHLGEVNIMKIHILARSTGTAPQSYRRLGIKCAPDVVEANVFELHTWGLSTEKKNNKKREREERGNDKYIYLKGLQLKRKKWRQSYFGGVAGRMGTVVLIDDDGVWDIDHMNVVEQETRGFASRASGPCLDSDSIAGTIERTVLNCDPRHILLCQVLA